MLKMCENRGEKYFKKFSKKVFTNQKKCAKIWTSRKEQTHGGVL